MSLAEAELASALQRQCVGTAAANRTADVPIHEDAKGSEMHGRTEKTGKKNVASFGLKKGRQGTVFLIHPQSLKHAHKVKKGKENTKPCSCVFISVTHASQTRLMLSDCRTNCCPDNPAVGVNSKRLAFFWKTAALKGSCSSVHPSRSGQHLSHNPARQSRCQTHTAVL